MFTPLAMHLHQPITTGTTHGKHLIELEGIVHQILNTYKSWLRLCSHSVVPYISL